MRAYLNSTWLSALFVTTTCNSCWNSERLRYWSHILKWGRVKSFISHWRISVCWGGPPAFGLSLWKKEKGSSSRQKNYSARFLFCFFSDFFDFVNNLVDGKEWSSVTCHRLSWLAVNLNKNGNRNSWKNIMNKRKLVTPSLPLYSYKNIFFSANIISPLRQLPGWRH